MIISSFLFLPGSHASLLMSLSEATQILFPTGVSIAANLGTSSELVSRLLIASIVLILIIVGEYAWLHLMGLVKFLFFS